MRRLRGHTRAPHGHEACLAMLLNGPLLHPAWPRSRRSRHWRRYFDFARKCRVQLHGSAATRMGGGGHGLASEAANHLMKPLTDELLGISAASSGARRARRAVPSGDVCPVTRVLSQRQPDTRTHTRTDRDKQKTGRGRGSACVGGGVLGQVGGEAWGGERRGGERGGEEGGVGGGKGGGRGEREEGEGPVCGRWGVVWCGLVKR